MDAYFEYEKSYKSLPHIVIVGAGASVAAIPNGDKNGLQTSVMDGFLEKLGMSQMISNLNLVTQSKNLEDIYSEIAESPKYIEARESLDKKIREYFSSFEIPDSPTIYDFLLLSLREKDMIATFNWDPLLLQAYQRVCKITHKLPNLAFLHGNVLVGYCENHYHGGRIDFKCPECGKDFIPSKLLYPIGKKNYNADPYVANNWKVVKDCLHKAYSVTIFGYSAPKTDVEAIGILKNAWGSVEKRNMEEFEFIDIKNDDELLETWKDFVHTHHYSCSNSFFKSSLAKFPRRTIEALFDQTQNCYWIEPTDPFAPEMTFPQLYEVVKRLVAEEVDNEGGFITLQHSVP